MDAALNVYEGLSHAQYLFNPAAPETKVVLEDIAAFFASAWQGNTGGTMDRPVCG